MFRSKLGIGNPTRHLLHLGSNRCYPGVLQLLQQCGQNKLLHMQKRLKPLVAYNFLTLPRRSCGSMSDVRDFIGRGLAAVTEVERIFPYTDFKDHRLQPLLKTAKEDFELALEVEKENADAMLWLARLHLYYNIPQACIRSGAVLLETAAESGHAEAQYELACRIHAEGALLGDDDAIDDRVFNYLESAACQAIKFSSQVGIGRRQKFVRRIRRIQISQ